MNTRILSSLVRLARVLFAAVFFVGSMLPGSSCCCSSLCCNESHGELSCSTADSACRCCCRQSGNPDASKHTCCCSEELARLGAACTSECCCVPVVNYGIVDNPQRRERTQGQEVWQDWWAVSIPLPKRMTTNTTVFLSTQSTGLN